jgi:hypothetical protein
MTSSHVTYGQLYQLLLDLQFVDEPAGQPWRVYRHGETDTFILLARRMPTLPAREADLASVRRHLVENGLMDDDDFNGFLSQGRVAGSV